MSSCPNGNGADGNRIDRTMYKQDLGNYVYHKDKLASGGYVDLHCIRPFSHVDEKEREKRWRATNKILELVGLI